MAPRPEPAHLPVFASPLLPFDPSDDRLNHDNEDSDDSSIIEKPENDDLQVTNAELFYDLFFVSNLTVFTYIHEVNDEVTLAQYIGFFGIIWFTWYHVGFFDARFSKDSLVERICKVLHFGIMIGFASIGPRFDIGEVVDEWSSLIPHTYFRSLTLVLMASRLVLALQYLQLLWFSKQYRLINQQGNERRPIIVVVVTYFVAALIYLGLYWSFQPDATPDDSAPEVVNPSMHAKNHSFVAWYVVAAVETAVVTWAVHFWKLLRTQPTHLQERMALLTLIILGEGVIGIAKQCQFIAQSKLFIWESSVVGAIVCALLVVYYMYMVYFDRMPKDWLEHKQFGLRQCAWSLLHFPLHLSMVLAVEGLNQCIIWRAAVIARDDLNNFYYQWGSLDDGSFQDTAQAWNTTAQDIVFKTLQSSKSFGTAIDGLNNIWDIRKAAEYISLGGESSGDFSDALTAIAFLYTTCFNSIFGSAGFGGSKKNYADAVDRLYSDKLFSPDDFEDIYKGLDKILQTAHVFEITFIYLFVTLGFVVVLCVLVKAVTDFRAARREWARSAVGLLVSFVLCMLALLAVGNNKRYYNFISSPWVVPTIMLLLLIVVIADNLRAFHLKLNWSS